MSDIIEGELVPEGEGDQPNPEEPPVEVLPDEDTGPPATETRPAGDPIRLSKREFFRTQLLVSGVPVSKINAALGLVCAVSDGADSDVRTVQEWDESDIELPEVDLTDLAQPEPTPPPNLGEREVDTSSD